MIYTLKQFAEMFHVTEHTIRYYTGELNYQVQHFK